MSFDRIKNKIIEKNDKYLLGLDENNFSPNRKYEFINGMLDFDPTCTSDDHGELIFIHYDLEIFVIIVKLIDMNENIKKILGKYIGMARWKK